MLCRWQSCFHCHEHLNHDCQQHHNNHNYDHVEQKQRRLLVGPESWVPGLWPGLWHQSWMVGLKSFSQLVFNFQQFHFNHNFHIPSFWMITNQCYKNLNLNHGNHPSDQVWRWLPLNHWCLRLQSWPAVGWQTAWVPTGTNGAWNGYIEYKINTKYNIIVAQLAVLTWLLQTCCYSVVPCWVVRFPNSYIQKRVGEPNYMLGGSET